MNRRTLFTSIGGGSSVAFAGCLDGASEGTGDGAPDDDGNGSDGTESDENSDDGAEADGNGDEASVPEPDWECGSDIETLSSVLLDTVDRNEGACHEDLTSSFVVANEREDAVTAAVGIASDGKPVFEGSYPLEAGERAIDQDVGAAADLESVTVSLEGGEEFSGEWADTACYRHAAVLTDDGIETGCVEPLSGPGDIQHDCYAGDHVPIRVSNGSSRRTATITVVDHCRESVEEEPLPLVPQEVARVEGSLTNGGRYDAAVEVEDGGTDAAEFYDACWGLSVSIDGDGHPEIAPTSID